MEKKIISFKGISNVPDDGLNEAGDMSVLLNMRHKGGELVPCRKPSEMPCDSKVELEQLQYHAQSGLWIELRGDKSLYVNPKGIIAQGVESFSIMGNVVVICFEDKVEYAIWNGEEYIYLGGLPEVPEFSVNVSKKKKLFMVETQLDDEYLPNNDSLYNMRFQKGNIDKTLAVIYSEGGYVDRAWFRVGIRLFDGTYIVGGITELSNNANESTPNANGDVTEKIIGVQGLWLAQGLGGGKSNYYTQLDYFIPTLTPSINLGKWSDIVASVDIFSTGSITTFAAGVMTKEDLGIEVPDIIEIYKMRTAEQLKDTLINAEFYRIASYDASGRKLSGIDNTSPSNIAAQGVLSNISTHSTIPNKAGVYNARLHTYEYKNRFFPGFLPATTFHGVPERDAAWTTYVHIKTDEGTVIVKREDSQNPLKHLSYFSYPDSRAYKMEIINTGDGKKQIVELIPHPVRNEAFYVNIGVVDVIASETIKIGEDDVDFDLYYYDFPYIKTGNWMTGEVPTVRDIVESKNTLKVSAVDNPFYFPTAQTYKFEGEIKGLASNAEAISTGQFGQYPLFVFTQEGIWAMQIDTSGQGAYLSQSPFSREVCNGAVCPVSGGVVFTTKRGLMAISGGQVTELSKPLDGLEEMLFNFSGALAGQIFARAGYDGYEKFEPVPIREYIQGESGNVKGESGAKLAYNYLQNEVILSNVNYGYSYVYSLTNQVWSVIDTVFDITTNSYPELVVYNNQEMKRYTFDDTTTGVVPVVAITRPFTLGSFDFKRLRQAGLRTTFEGSLNFYLLGSNDGAEFKCITGKEVDADILDSGTYRDLVTAMSRSKQYKYFAIAIAGQMSGRVSMAELLVDAGFANNKIR